MLVDTSKTRITSKAIDLTPFYWLAPRLITILGEVDDVDRPLLDSSRVMKSVCALYSLSPRAFMDEERDLPPVDDIATIRSCLELIPEMYYDREVLVAHAPSKDGSVNTLRYERQEIWPLVEAAFREILCIRAQVRLDIERHVLNAKLKHRAAFTFARILTYQVTAIVRLAFPR